MTTAEVSTAPSVTQDAAIKAAATVDDPPTEKSKSDKEKEEEKAAPFSNYWRILGFGTRTNHCILFVAASAAAASGVALPLMNIFFGRLVGDFNSFFIPGGSTTRAEFRHSVAQNALIFVYLFIGKFVLTYIAMVCVLIFSPLRLADILSVLVSLCRSQASIHEGSFCSAYRQTGRSHFGIRLKHHHIVC
jgi:hypothetical protein